MNSYDKNKKDSLPPHFDPRGEFLCNRSTFLLHKKVLRNLDLRYMKANKQFNTFILISIIITCVLFTNIFTILFSMNYSMREQIFEEVGSKDSGSFDYLTLDEMNLLMTDKRIQSSSYLMSGGRIENEELNKKFQTDMFYFSPDHFGKYKDNNITNVAGSYPTKKNEVMVSIPILKELNVKPELGAELELKYNFQGGIYTKKLILSGYYDFKRPNQQQIAFVSQEFINENIYKGQANYVLYVNLKSNTNLGEKFSDIISDKQLNKEEADRNSFTINPAYSKYVFVDPGLFAAIGIALFLVLLTGYFIIYNIFHISIINNIRFYGLLRNAGFTSRQIRRFVLKQGFYLTAYSLLPGLLIGYVIGNLILPFFGGMLNMDLYIPFHPFIFILASVFVIVTVYISMLAPARFANKVSEAESLKINGAGHNTKNKKLKVRTKISMFNLAMINVLRNKTQFFVLVFSLSLMPILFNSVYTFVQSLDYDSYVNNFMPVDFIAGHYKYFTYRYDKYSTLDDQFIEYVNKGEIEESGIIYLDKVMGRSYSDQGFERVSDEIYTTVYENKEYDIQMYGLDPFPLSKYEVIRGEWNEELLSTGKYVIEVIEVDDFGNPDESSMRFAVGDTLEINYNNEKVKEYTVLAQVKEISAFSDLNGTLDFIASLALPSEEYLNISENPKKMSYVFNAEKKNLGIMNERLTNYVTNIDNNMQFQSVLSYGKQFEEVRFSFLLPGIFISGMIGFIGIMNFILVLIASMIARKKELRILYDVGMTAKQMKRMFMLEGVFYTFFSSAVFVVGGVIFNTSIVKYLIDHIWFMKYHVSFIVLLLVIPVYAICAAAVTKIVGNRIMKQSDRMTKENLKKKILLMK